MITESDMDSAATQSHELPREIWGVIGGMGPLASAEFMKTIYRFEEKYREQDMPVVMLVSDPSVPDRTECFLKGDSHLLVKRLESSIRQLDALDVTHIVVCCLTIHWILPLVSWDLRRKVLSLVELVLSAVVQSEKRHLLLCTSGSRAMHLFENHELWEQAAGFIVMPSEADQEAVHKLIYRIKGNRLNCDDTAFLKTLATKYNVEILIAGCTELHLIAGRAEAGPGGIQWLDPLLIAAARIARGRPSMQAPASSFAACG